MQVVKLIRSYSTCICIDCKIGLTKDRKGVNMLCTNYIRRHGTILKIVAVVTALTFVNVTYYKSSLHIVPRTLAKASDPVDVAKLFYTSLNKSEESLNQFWHSVRAQFGNDTLYPRSFDVRQVTTALRHGKIINADLFRKQTSLKLKLIYEGGQSAIFKVMLIDRENKTTKPCNNACEHPEYEIVAFTLNRMFDLRNMPYTTGRYLSWYKELEHVASPKLKEFIQVQEDRSVCLDWSCLRIPRKRYCFKNGEIPGAVIYFIEDKDIKFRKSDRGLYHGYYRFGIADSKDLSRLPGDKKFCLKFRRGYPYSEDDWFMDIVDIAVLDFLMSHMDAKHTYITDRNNDSQPEFNVMFDFGHAFCRTNSLVALAPLLQCCRFRTRLYKSMSKYSETLKETFISLTKDDPLHPILLPELMDDLKHKLKQTLSLMDFCLNLDGASEVLRNV